MNVYVSYHCAPVPGAPEALTTYVTPTPATSREEVENACRQHEPQPVREIQHYELTYPPMPTDPVVALAFLRDYYKDCARCHLSEQRNFIVHFRGNPYSPVLCLGEGPGRTEDQRAIPFCGSTGRYQDEMFRGAGIDPDQLAWGNMVGCRPCESRHGPDREPTLVEKIACSERTLMFLRAIRPRVIICLGKVAADAFFEELPHVNSWTQLAHPDRPLDWVALAHLRHPSYMLRMGAMTTNYKEFMAQRLFLEGLREWMPSLSKVAEFPLGLRYLANAQPVAGKPEPKK